jgi:PAS domain-containing protein
VRWFGTNTDITEQMEMQQALRESEQQFRTLANSIPQMAWMADHEGYRFWYNDRWYDYTGTTFKLLGTAKRRWTSFHAGKQENRCRP